MNLIHDLAIALAMELRQRYPLDEIHALPSFHYELNGETVAPIGGNVVPTSYTLAAVRDAKSLWSINIGDGTLSITITKDEPPFQKFDKIAGTEGTELEGLSMGLIISKEADTTKFILAEPGCIEKVMAKIEEHYPVSGRISDQENVDERGPQETL